MSDIDIVKRLRFGYSPTSIGNKNANADAIEAADEILNLRAELENEKNTVRIICSNNKYLKEGE